MTDEPVAEAVMVRIRGKVFHCIAYPDYSGEPCNANVFTCEGDIFTCNACGTQYEGT